MFGKVKAPGVSANDPFVAAPFVRGAYAAGKRAIGLWDHWVPGANESCKATIDQWAAKEKVEVQVDFITLHGNKLLLTGAAQAQAKSGHDIFTLTTWLPARYANVLVPTCKKCIRPARRPRPTTGPSTPS